jgi:hypothetical protein
LHKEVFNLMTKEFYFWRDRRKTSTDILQSNSSVYHPRTYFVCCWDEAAAQCCVNRIFFIPYCR